MVLKVPYLPVPTLQQPLSAVLLSMSSYILSLFMVFPINMLPISLHGALFSSCPGLTLPHLPWPCFWSTELKKSCLFFFFFFSFLFFFSFSFLSSFFSFVGLLRCLTHEEQPYYSVTPSLLLTSPRPHSIAKSGKSS